MKGMEECGVAIEIVTCPICDEFKRITLHLRLPSEDDPTANYECEDCGCKYDEEGKEL